MMKRLVLSVISTLCIVSISFARQKQTSQLGQDTTQNVITTAVPFLTITPDARSGAMGDLGVAISPDANSVYWNPSKLAFAKNAMGAAISYTPWLQNLVNDMSLTKLSGYKKISKEETIAASMYYFDLGDMQFTDDQGNLIRDFSPKEFSFDLTYARKLSDRFGIGGTARFIHSNLSGNIAGGGNVNSRPGNTAAVDLSMFYKNEDVMIGSMPTTVAFGANISNIGAKITYSSADQKDFIPTNLRLGTAVTAEIDPMNKLMVGVDLNKLLVPTPPEYDVNGVIVAGKDPNRTLVSGILGSFSDAPNGFKEEIREVMLSLGTEYSYNDLFFARAGYFYESKFKGNRQYFTMGVGIKYQSLGLDVSYLVPNQQNHPLSNTLRFSLVFDIKGSSKLTSVND